MIRFLPVALALLPQAAWAHGDHAEGSGVQHVLTSPEHLGVLLLAGSVLAVLWRRRAGKPNGEPRQVRKGTA